MPGEGERGRDQVRWFLPLGALCVLAIAAATDPGRWWELGLLGLATLVLAAWAWLDPPLVLIAPAVMGLTAGSQSSGALEPGMLLLSLLAIVLTGWQGLRWSTALLVLLTLAAPFVVGALQGPDGLAPAIWVLGILLPAVMGWAFHRQEALAAELDRARTALAEQAVLEERRRIARDVHDLVGHGLAGMMLQVTSARHVMDRDPRSASEALASAEEVGRRTMQELRRTVGILRDDSDAPAGERVAPAPISSLEDLADIVADARSNGLSAEHVARGPQADVDEATGLTLYRIAQAAIANAAIHAPAARTVVTSTVTTDDVTLEVRSVGHLSRHSERDERRGHYGLRGMRERAESIGGEFWAGPVPGGWLVRCRVLR